MTKESDDNKAKDREIKEKFEEIVKLEKNNMLLQKENNNLKKVI